MSYSVRWRVRGEAQRTGSALRPGHQRGLRGGVRVGVGSGRAVPALRNRWNHSRGPRNAEGKTRRDGHRERGTESAMFRTRRAAGTEGLGRTHAALRGQRQRGREPRGRGTPPLNERRRDRRSQEVGAGEGEDVGTGYKMAPFSIEETYRGKVRRRQQSAKSRSGASAHHVRSTTNLCVPCHLCVTKVSFSTLGAACVLTKGSV